MSGSTSAAGPVSPSLWQGDRAGVTKSAARAVEPLRARIHLSSGTGVPKSAARAVAAEWGAACLPRSRGRCPQARSQVAGPALPSPWQRWPGRPPVAGVRPPAGADMERADHWPQNLYSAVPKRQGGFLPPGAGRSVPSCCTRHESGRSGASGSLCVDGDTDPATWVDPDTQRLHRPCHGLGGTGPATWVVLARSGTTAPCHGLGGTGPATWADPGTQRRHRPCHGLGDTGPAT